MMMEGDERTRYARFCIHDGPSVSSLSMYRRIARVALVAVIGTAALSYATFEKRLTVVIEGEPVAIRTFAPNVGVALERAGIELAPFDRVTPDLASPITEGGRIEIKRAKVIRLIDDGRARRVRVTALRVRGALRELGIEPSMKDVIQPSPASKLTDGSIILYRPAARVLVRVGGHTRRLATTTPRVKGVLAELGISLGRLDRVRPHLLAKVDRGDTIVVERVRRTVVAQRVHVPYRTVTKRTRNLDFGRKRLVRGGRPGLQRVRYRVTFVDGSPESRVVIGSKMIRRPINRVVLVGARPPRVARCVCSKGSAIGGASWYHRSDGLTAAHRTLPFGTIVRVENLENGRVVNVRIADRGPFIDGRVIDLSDDAFRRVASLGEGVIRVRISW